VLLWCLVNCQPLTGFPLAALLLDGLISSDRLLHQVDKLVVQIKQNAFLLFSLILICFIGWLERPLSVVGHQTDLIIALNHHSGLIIIKLATMLVV
jgi:hypothetical protein